jgi:cytochrome c
MNVKGIVPSVLIVACVAGLTVLVAIGQDNPPDPQMHPMGMEHMMMMKSQQPDTSKAAQDSLKEAADLGIGPIKKVELDTTIDAKLAEQGRSTFNEYCSQCHAMSERKAGPPLGSVTKTRTPEFVMNMMLNPTGMEQHDPVARRLLEEYHVPMPELNLSQDQARSILEYLRTMAPKEEKQ